MNLWPGHGRSLLLWLLAMGLLSAVPHVTLGAEDDPVVARVNAHEIRLSHIYDLIEALPLGEQIAVRDRIGQFAESVITEEILFQGALTDDMSSDPELREQLKSTVVEYLIKKYVRDRIQISGADIQTYYEQNRDLVRGKHVRFRHILLKTRHECDDLRGRIDSEQAFMRQAAARSLDRQSAPEGGDLGYVMPIPGALGFEPQLFGLSIGEMGVFESAQGCHLVWVTEIIDPPQLTPEQIRSYVLPILEREREQALLQEFIATMARRVKVERYLDKLQ